MIDDPVEKVGMAVIEVLKDTRGFMNRAMCVGAGDPSDRDDDSAYVIERIGKAAIAVVQEMLVSDEMAEAGADHLREAKFGDDLKDVVTEVFYIMQGVAKRHIWTPAHPSHECKNVGDDEGAERRMAAIIRENQRLVPSSDRQHVGDEQRDAPAEIP